MVTAQHNSVAVSAEPSPLRAFCITYSWQTPNISIRRVHVRTQNHAHAWHQCILKSTPRLAVYSHSVHLTPSLACRRPPSHSPQIRVLDPSPEQRDPTIASYTQHRSLPDSASHSGRRYCSISCLVRSRCSEKTSRRERVTAESPESTAESSSVAGPAPSAAFLLA